MTNRTSRRSFVKSSAVAGVGFWAAGGVVLAQSNSPNEQINFACVGVGGKGRSDSADADKRGNVVAICDIDDNTLTGASRKFRDAKVYNDYRKMLDEMGKSIDAITVSTPDHMHALISVAAMRMGKHCFTQKPLTHSIHEARLMAQVARDSKVATQMGNQGTAEDGVREAAAIIRSGALGTINEVHVWTNRPVWPQGLDRPEAEPVPSHIHWDLFLGGAPQRPYNKAYHPFKWRGFWDFGTGALGDMACHTMNMPFMALDLRNPTSVVAETSGHNKETYPRWSVITYEFPEHNGRPALTLKWYDGGKLPDRDLVGKDFTNSGCLLIGDKGKLYSPNDYGAKFELIDVEKPEVEYEKSPGHFDEWVRAIQEGVPARSDFADYAGPLTETVLLGNLAVWAGEKVEWDSQSLRATNIEGLEPLIQHEYQNGYSLT